MLPRSRPSLCIVFIVAVFAVVARPAQAVAQDTYAALEKAWSDAESAYWAKVEAAEAKPDSAGKPGDKPTYPYAEFAPRFKALAEKHAKTSDALPPLFWLIVNCNPASGPIAPPPDAQWAIENLTRFHAADFAMKEHSRDMRLAVLAVGVKPMERILNAVGMLNPDKEAQAAAVYALGFGIWMNDVLATDAEGKPVDNPDARERAKNVFNNCVAGFPGTKGAEGAQAFLYEIEKLQVGQPAPDLAGKDADGRDLKLADLKGRVVVLKFWRYTCPDCRKQIPHERELVERLKDKPFTLLGIATDESPDALRKMLDDNKVNWPNIYDGKRGEGAISKQWNIVRVPTIYVIDQEGVIRHRDLTGKALDEAIEKLLGK
jgi:peroxiredoxin